MSMRRSACLIFVAAPSWHASAADLAPIGWPGADAALSNAAWPDATQPKVFGSWPGGTEVGSCSTLKVLRDHATGWPGQCIGLSPAVSPNTTQAIETISECEAICRAVSTCAIWQFVVGTGGGCFHGSTATDCSKPGTVAVAGAQRLQHGEVVVMKNMTSWWVLNLKNVGIWSTGTTQEGAEMCRLQCYSDIYCQYWQYGDQGCWVESKDFPAEHPLTTPNGACGPADCTEATTVYAAEYIAHSCPTQTANKQGEVENNSMRKTLMMIAVAVACLFIAVMAFFYCCGQGEKKTRAVKKTRAIRVEASQENREQPMAALSEAHVPFVPLSMPASYAPSAPMPAATYQQLPQGPPVALQGPVTTTRMPSPSPRTIISSVASPALAFR